MQQPSADSGQPPKAFGTSQGTYNCISCGDTFSSPESLDEHIRTHKGQYIRADQRDDARRSGTSGNKERTSIQRPRPRPLNDMSASSPLPQAPSQGTTAYRPRICGDCKTEFYSRFSYQQHKAFDNKCWANSSENLYFHFCPSCNVVLNSPGQIEQHVQKFPQCQQHLVKREAETYSALISYLPPAHLVTWLDQLVPKLYQQNVVLHLAAARSFTALASPLTGNIARQVHVRLQLLREEARKSKSKRLASMLKDYLEHPRSQDESGVSRTEQHFHAPPQEQDTRKRPKAVEQSRVQEAERRQVQRGDNAEAHIKSDILVKRAVSRTEQQPQTPPREQASLKGPKAVKGDRTRVDGRRQIQRLDNTQASTKIKPLTSATPPKRQESQGPPMSASPKDTMPPASFGENNSEPAQQLQVLLERVRILQEQLATSPPATSLPKQASVTPSQANATNVPAELLHSLHSKVSGIPVSQDTFLETRTDDQRLSRQIHTQSRAMKSSDHIKTAVSSPSAIDPTPLKEKPKEPSSPSAPLAPASSESNEHSLLEELFPEAGSYVKPQQSDRNPYPKLDLPDSTYTIKRISGDKPKTAREKYIEAFQSRHEQIIALQLLHCSTELTEADFRRVIPKGQHIESWAREGEFYRIIPGRDPLSLERLPFYYILFRSSAAALAYQKNVSRLHKLSQLHQPDNILSAIPLPNGFLEDGEDINLATSSYLLKPTNLDLTLNMLMQPYDPNLRTLFEQGGYKPIVPSVTDNGKQLWKVLIHIEGYEPSHVDLFQLFSQDGHSRGFQWPIHNDQSGIHRLRDVVDVKTKPLSLSSANPWADDKYQHGLYTRFDAKDSSNSQSEATDQEDARQIHQTIMNRVYNRWVIDFEEEEAARRFARVWNRKILPFTKSAKRVAWKDIEETRMCNTEFLW